MTLAIAIIFCHFLINDDSNDCYIVSNQAEISTHKCQIFYFILEYTVYAMLFSHYFHIVKPNLTFTRHDYPPQKYRSCFSFQFILDLAHFQ